MGVLNLDPKELRYYVSSDYNKIFTAKPLMSGGVNTKYYLLCEMVFVKDENKHNQAFGYVNKAIVKSDDNMFIDLDSAKLICELNNDE